MSCRGMFAIAMLRLDSSMRLRRIMRQSGLPPEVLLDLALEILDIASRKLSLEQPACLRRKPDMETALRRGGQ